MSSIYKAPDYTPLAANVSRAANNSTGYGSLAAFLYSIDCNGVQVQNNFEVTFSGCDGLTFYTQSFELPGSKQNTCDVYYDGIKVTIPINYEHEHEFSMVVINDAKGMLYTALKSYIELDSYNHYTCPSATMRVKSLTGQVKNMDTDSWGSKSGFGYPLRGSNGQGSSIEYCGADIVAYGVRFTSIGGLSYGQSSNDVQTFTLNGTMVEYSHLPLTLAKKVHHESIYKGTGK